MADEAVEEPETPPVTFRGQLGRILPTLVEVDVVFRCQAG
jgi:hypothetical protein